MTKALVCWCAVFICMTSAEGQLIVTSPAGTFQGAEMTSQSGVTFAAFRGIPFAKPPVGPLRFAKPQQVPKLQGVYDATQQGPMCIQPPGTDIGGVGFGQEDCLYLNVFTPLSASTDAQGNMTSEKNGNTTSLLKVFVYIHGGGWVVGSANQFIPGNLVAQGNVIVVTMNYRLSWLGFLKGNTPEVPGNQGTWDQLMALTWVKDNIRAFGGDERDITLGGESAGANSVSLLGITEHAKDLFTKGILMSPASFVDTGGPGSTDSLLPTLAHTLGCWNSTSVNNAQTQIQAAVDCLRSLPESKFSLFPMLTPGQAIAFDGDLFKAPIAQLVENQDHLDTVGFYKRNYLVTATNNEGPIVLNNLRFSAPSEKGEYDHISTSLNIPLPVFEKMLLWYSHPSISENSPLFDLLSDLGMMPGVWDFLKVHTDNRQVSDQGKSYFLRFEHYPAFMPWPYKGVFHAMDLTYLFDITPNEILKAYYWITTDQQFTQQDFDIKRKLIDTFVCFMDTCRNQDHWTPYGPQNETYQSFGPFTSLKQFPLKARRDFWNHTVPSWIRDHVTRLQSTPQPNSVQSNSAPFNMLIVSVICVLCGRLVN